MWEAVRIVAETISTVFLTLVKSLLAPLLFGLIVSALGRSRGDAATGRIGLRAIVYFESITTVALLVGWAAMAISQSGAAFARPSQSENPASSIRLADMLIQAVPASIFEAMANNTVLQMIIFFGILGWAARSRAESAEPLIAFAESVQAATMAYAGYVMKLAPLGMISAIVVTLLNGGWNTARGLGGFVAAAVSAQLFMGVVVYGTVLLMARLPILRFLDCTKESIGIALATTSSAAALPKALDGMERFGVRPQLLGIVMPLGLSFNLSGSTIQLMMGVLFAAQAARIDIPLPQMLLVLLTLKIASKGVAGIPRANFVILSGTLPMFQLPLDTLPLLLAIDGIIDMVRTPVNVLGNCVAAAFIARWEGEELSQAASPSASPARR